MALLKGRAAAAGPELDESARAFGLVIDGDTRRAQDGQPIEVWAENWPAVQLFSAMVTQLRPVGLGGVEGFDYAALPIVEHRIRLPRRHRRAAFEGLQVMERALVAHVNK